MAADGGEPRAGDITISMGELDRWDLRISEWEGGGVEVRGGKRCREREEVWSGGSGGKGGERRASPEVEDDGCTAEARPGSTQRNCIGKRVRERLTLYSFVFS
ncbi:hypothetical protein HID58_024642 [Brassica napus]|uniref:Uncharacterized protein n=1 Tax=Brassica napus TaxID=3708 RepID=A0ABQ8CIS2_BRANA|nr:hypothetical protein HID58_024642 [Brassica napus]